MAYSVLEDLGLEVRANGERPSMIKGVKNPIVWDDLRSRLVTAQVAPDWEVATAGTHVIEGQPMSWRTREAMARLGYSANGHRSHQLNDADVAVPAGFKENK